MAELADALVLGTSGEIHSSSTLDDRTTLLSILYWYFPALIEAADLQLVCGLALLGLDDGPVHGAVERIMITLGSRLKRVLGSQCFVDVHAEARLVITE